MALDHNHLGAVDLFFNPFIEREISVPDDYSKKAWPVRRHYDMLKDVILERRETKNRIAIDFLAKIFVTSPLIKDWLE